MPQPPQHNIANGPIHVCQVCGQDALELVIDLGYQPLCDSLLSAEDLQHPETSYPLRQMWCRNCTLSQIDYVVPGEVVFHANYPYRTGVTRELAAYQDEMAASIVAHLETQADSLVVDIGSNDGTLLSSFKQRGCRVVGVEPTNIAKFAQEAGVETLQMPFDQQAAQAIVDSHGKAKVVTATNVFAHIAALGDVLQGLEILVADDGHFVLENHYLQSVMDRLQFDTIYHEHLKTYSLLSLVTLFDFYDFTVVDAEKVSRYGGNIRVYVAKGKGHKPSKRVGELLAAETQAGFQDPAYYKNFRQKSIELKNQLLELFVQCAQSGHPIVGNSCPGRCSTLLNYLGVGPDLMPYIGEQPTSLKLNKFLPGKHIPVVNNQRLIDEQPKNVMLLAWHYAKPITEQLRARGLTSRLIEPMPELKFV